jgi:hypothetical protein
MPTDTSTLARSGESEAIVLIKAAPQAGHRHGETVCCAGVGLDGKWLRLYPVSFRTLDDGQKFGRWDRVHFRWKVPSDDLRIESRRIDQDSIEIVGELRKSERERFLAPLIRTSLEVERRANRSLALLKTKILAFRPEKKKAKDLAAEASRFAALHAQANLFTTKSLIPYEPCPYHFKYKYETDDGVREGTCQDWEIEATYYKWAKEFGDAQALDRMCNVFGEQYPKKGMLLAMGTHSQYPDTWLINGVIRMDDIAQLSLF